MMKSCLLRIQKFMLLTALATCVGTVAYAAVTDISDTPLASASNSIVKPNVMFILDDSGSMAWSYLGDDVYSKGYVNKVGYRNSICNKAYYNPAVNYVLPVYADGSPYPEPAFTAAYYDGFRGNSVQINLSTGFMAWRSNDSNPRTPSGYTQDCSSGNDSCDPGSGSDRISNSQSAAYYFVYKGNRAANLGDNSSNDHCKNGNSNYSSNWTRVVVSATSGVGNTDERQNFANWYSYYRTRMLAMKTAAGLAFKSINDNYRIGYTTHSYTGTSATSASFLKIDDFTYASDGTGHKNKWYDKLYGAGTSGGTPLRTALSKVGRIYAGKLLTGTNDPIQYSCQQNFAILATDGYWNGGAGYQMDGSTAVGNQDGGTTARPMLDGLNKSDTLADVAMYYYQTDLRGEDDLGALGIKVGKNNVPGSGADVQLQQHMTTFTLGLGLNGTLDYSENYLSGGSNDFNAITAGTKNWPAPKADDPTAIDDLWHAAVNGRGTYFSAQNPNSLITGLSKALAGVSARTGAAASAATSNLEPVAGDNFLFVALYRTVKWDGDLQARTIDPSNGSISTTPLWGAQAELDKKVSATTDTRTIYTFDASTANKLKSFTWDALTDAEKVYFKNTCTDNLLSQCPDLSSTQRDAVDVGDTLVAFLRGRTANEDQTGNANPLFRDREHVLGDMIGAQPVYVKRPTFSYLDANYLEFKEVTQTNRLAMVYAAANDGMLHAFEATTGLTTSGSEKWAYIPPIVLPNLYKLADKNYSTKHQYYVDGSPTIADICPNAPTSTCTADEWKTILVGGLNKGGKGYYALDITNPASPKALWNYSVADDADMGYSFGNPIIAKRRDGTWVVAITSGYNNTGGDGRGHLYLLNANTGARLEKLSTSVGSAGSPSGLAKINAWVDTTVDNTAKRYYGGDLMGNVWRFDTEDIILPAGKEATLLAELGNVSPAGIQPITIRPLLSEISVGGNNYAVVTVATGRYLGNTDRSDTSQQSVYALKDTLAETGLGQVRAPDVLVQQTLTTNQAGTERTTSSTAVDWNAKSGWFVDLNPNNESPGERVNVGMQQQLGLLTVAGNVPEQNACTVGGYAWLYFFDYRTGQYSMNSANQMAGRRLTGNALVAGITTIRLGTGKTTTLVTDTGGVLNNESNPPPPPDSLKGARRVSWQELIVD